jgi:3-keto-5-aminohexanoate cleavage enzyme
MKTIARSLWDIDLEESNPTMNKKLCITVCPNGALITRNQNPLQPYTPEEVAQQAIEAYEQGAVMLHFHGRTEDGWVSNEPDEYIETVERVLSECPDMIMCPSISIRPKTSDIGLYEVSTTQPLVDALLKKGKRYIETTVVSPCSYESLRPVMPGEKSPLAFITPEKLKAEVEFLQKKGIKPEFMGHSFEAIENVHKYLIKPGILQKPYFVSMGPGMHPPSARMLMGKDPWGYLYLITMKASIPPNSVIGLSAGGHHWLPLSVMAIMLGVDFIRVGMEDSIWLYPHKDDLVKSCAQVTKKIVNIAKELGREIATPDEAREILGIKK